MEPIVVRCEKCGKFHRNPGECRARWSRRGFLAMLGAGAAVAVAQPVLAVEPCAEVTLNSILSLTLFGNASGVLPVARQLHMTGAFPKGGTVFVTCGGKEGVFNIPPCADVKDHRFNLPQSVSAGTRIYVASAGSIILAP